jgi:hypothetical protein
MLKVSQLRLKYIKIFNLQFQGGGSASVFKLTTSY